MTKETTHGQGSADREAAVEARVQELMTEYRAYATGEDWDPEAYLERALRMLEDAQQSGEPNSINRQALTEFLERIRSEEDSI